MRWFRSKWRVVKTTWPNREGYGVYNRRKRVLLDSGLSQHNAQRKCDRLNTPHGDGGRDG